MKVVVIFLSCLASAFGAGVSYYYPYIHPNRYVAASPVVESTVYGAAPAAVGTNTQYHAQDTLGQYSYGYVTADGQAKVESKAVDGTVSGSYSYTDPQGKPVRVDYVADEKGFRASGDHLPKQGDVPDLPDDLEDAYEEAHENLEKARYKALAASLVSTPTASYVYAGGAPVAYTTYPVGYQYYGVPGLQRYTATRPGGFQYAFSTGASPYFQRYSVARPVDYSYSYGTGYPGFQRYTAAVKPAGFSYYTTSYSPYTAYPAAYTSYTGGKSAYTYSY